MVMHSIMSQLGWNSETSLAAAIKGSRLELIEDLDPAPCTALAHGNLTLDSLSRITLSPALLNSLGWQKSAKVEMTLGLGTDPDPDKANATLTLTTVGIARDEHMNCANTSCLHNTDYKCTLDGVNINTMGNCDDCIPVKTDTDLVEA